MKKAHPALLSVLTLALGIALFATGLGAPAGPRLTAPPIQWRTPAERSATLDALRDAWENRPLAINAENERAERIFLNRVINFLNRNKRREIYSEACGFWNACYHDHAEHYRDFLASK